MPFFHLISKKTTFFAFVRKGRLEGRRQRQGLYGIVVHCRSSERLWGKRGGIVGDMGEGMGGVNGTGGGGKTYPPFLDAQLAVKIFPGKIDFFKTPP